MKKILSSNIVLALLGGLLYLGVTAALLLQEIPKYRKEAAHQPSPLTLEQEVNTSGPSWDYVNPVADELVRQLQQKEKILAERKTDLDSLSKQIERERAYISSITNRVHELQADLDQTIITISQAQRTNYKEIVGFYQKMPPAEASKLIYELEDKEIARVLKFLKPTETSAILQTWIEEGPQKMARVTRILEQYQNVVFMEQPSPPAPLPPPNP